MCEVDPSLRASYYAIFCHSCGSQLNIPIDFTPENVLLKVLFEEGWSIDKYSSREYDLRKKYTCKECKA